MLLCLCIYSNFRPSENVVTLLALVNLHHVLVYGKCLKKTFADKTEIYNFNK